MYCDNILRNWEILKYYNFMKILYNIDLCSALHVKFHNPLPNYSSIHICTVPVLKIYVRRLEVGRLFIQNTGTLL